MTLGRPDDEWQRLNAFVDGEASEDERDRLRQRIRVDPLFAVQVVGLRQLKADLRAGAKSRAPHHRPYSIAAAAAAAAAILLGIGTAWFSGRVGLGERGSTADVVAELGAALVFTNDRAGSAPGAYTVPALDLKPAGFNLVSSVTSPTSHAPMLVYEGAHGCRVGLTVAVLPQGSTHTGDAAARTWVIDGRTFTLVTRAMDTERFSHLAAAVEMLIRDGDDERVALAFQRSTQGRTCLG